MFDSKEFVESIQPGDEVTLKWNKREVTGPVASYKNEILYLDIHAHPLPPVSFGLSHWKIVRHVPAPPKWKRGQIAKVEHNTGSFRGIFDGTMWRSLEGRELLGTPISVTPLILVDDSKITLDDLNELYVYGYNKGNQRLESLRRRDGILTVVQSLGILKDVK